MAPILSYFESVLGWLFSSQKGRDAGLFTRLEPISSCPKTITVFSSSGMTKEHTPLGANIIPHLEWSMPETKEAIQEYLVVAEDPDAPLPSPIVHGIYYGIPAHKTTITPEDLELVEQDGYKVLKGSFRYGANRRKTIWMGARPVISHGVHRYFFQVIALRERLTGNWKDSELTKEELLKLVEGNVIAWGEWIGPYERRLE